MNSKETFQKLIEHEAARAALAAKRPSLGHFPSIAEARYRARDCADRFEPYSKHFELNRSWYQCKVNKITAEGVEWEVWYPRSEPDYEGEFFTTWAELDAGMQGAQDYYNELCAAEIAAKEQLEADREASERAQLAYLKDKYE